MNDPKADILIFWIKKRYWVLSFFIFLFILAFILDHLSHKRKIQDYYTAVNAPHKIIKCGYYQGWREDRQPSRQFNGEDYRIRYSSFLFEKEKTATRIYGSLLNFGTDEASKSVWNNLIIGQQVCLTFSMEQIIAIHQIK